MPSRFHAARVNSVGRTRSYDVKRPTEQRKFGALTRPDVHAWSTMSDTHSAFVTPCRSDETTSHPATIPTRLRLPSCSPPSRPSLRRPRRGPVLPAAARDGEFVLQAGTGRCLGRTRRWNEVQQDAWSASNPRGADAAENRSTPATGQRRRKAADQDAGLFPIPAGLARPGIALFRQQSREPKEAARNARPIARRREIGSRALGQSARELLQAPVFVSAPTYVTYPRGAVSGSREPSRHRKPRVVSAGRLRSRLPPPRRRTSIQRNRALPCERRPDATSCMPFLHADAICLLPVCGFGPFRKRT